jgi:hypothetical protein
MKLRFGIVFALLTVLVLTAIGGSEPAEAQFVSCSGSYGRLGSVYGFSNCPSAGPTYSGPGDAVTGGTAWYGVVAYNAAYATGSNPGATIRCSSGPSSGSTFTINILTTGILDIATAQTDCGTDGTVTASTSGSSTTLTISALLSGQVTIGDQITGTGVTSPTYISAMGTCVSGAIVPSCTVIISRANTITSTTITAQGGRYVTQWTDQTGNSNTATQATNADQMPLLAGCIGSIPCIGWVSTGSTAIGYASSAFTGGATVFSLVGVANRTVVGSFPTLIGGSSGNNILQWRNSANTMGFFTSNGQLATATAADGAAHIFQGITTASAGSTLNVDNASIVSPGAAGGVSISGPMCFPFNCGNGDMTGFVFAGGYWPVGFTAGQQTSICHSLFTSIGTSTSC